MNDEVEADLREIADQHDRPFDALREEWEERREEIRGNMTDVASSRGEDWLDSAAVKQVKANIQFVRRTVGGEAEEFPVCAVGHYGTFTGWGQDDDEVVVGLGVAAPEDTENENRPAGPTVFICKESVGMDLGQVREAFRFGNHLNATFSLERNTEDFTDRTRTYYVASSTEASVVEETDLSGTLPPKDELITTRDFLADNFFTEEAALASIAEDLSKTEDVNFGANWLDVRRFEGQVVDVFRRRPEDCEGDDEPFGTTKLVDESVGTPEEVKQLPVYDSDDEDKGRTPGLSVFLPYEMIDFGTDSVVEVYGILSRNRETGKITMNGAGVCPIVSYPYDGPGGEDDGMSDDAETDEL